MSYPFGLRLLSVCKTPSHSKTKFSEPLILLGMLLFLICPNGLSQSPVLDSLKTSLSQAPKSGKSQLSLAIAKRFRYTNYDSVVHYGNKAIEYALYLDDKEMIVESLLELAYINISIGEKEKSLPLYMRAKQVSIAENNNHLLVKTYLDLNRYYISFSDYAAAGSTLDTALDIVNNNHLTALKPHVYGQFTELYIQLQDYTIARHYARLAINTSIGESNKIHYVESNILLGDVYYHNKEYDSAFYHYNQALSLAKKLHDELLMEHAYRRISSYYIEKTDYPQALHYIDSSITYCNKLDLPNELASLITYKAHISSIKGDYHNTLQLNLQALALREKIGHRLSICASLLNVGGNYTQLGAYAKAHDYLERGIQIAEDQNAFSYLSYGYQKLHLQHKLQGNYQQALTYLELKTAYNDSLITKRTNEKIVFLKKQFELEKKSSLSAREKLTKKKNEAVFLIIIIALSIGIIALLSWLNYVRNKKNKEITKAKEKAEENEIQLHAILENAPTGFAINKISTGEVTYVNKAFSAAYHIPHDLCSSVSVFFEYVYSDQPELGNRIIDDLKSGEPERMNWYAVPITDKLSNTTHYVYASNIILKDLDLMISVVLDITEQVQNENQLKQAMERATESDRLKTAFLANMSHEIRTPMNGILGFAELLKEPDLSGEQQQTYIRIIEKSGKRMLGIINDIISISKIESGQMEVNVTESNINEQLEYIVSFFKPEVERQGMRLSLRNTLPSSEAVLITDREKVYAILTNLVKNAIKYSERGSIELGCYLKDDKEAAEVVFYVKDTGIGIPHDRQEAIFERFIQADIADTKAYQGAGLGLSISKAYVEMLGGNIWVESEVGMGSTFYFTLPYTAHPKEEIPPAKEVSTHTNAETATHHLKILIVEDDEPSEAFISIAVRKFGKEVLTAKTGQEAVDACRTNPDIDLVLMDIQLPIMNGYEATRQIRGFNKQVVIVAQTAFALGGDREKAMAAGCNDYIAKPISRQTLEELISAYF